MGFKLSDITVEPFMFLSMNTFVLNLVALPQIILDNVCLLKHNETTCHAMFIGSHKELFDIVQKQSTLWLGALLVIATLITVLTLPFVGTISDKFGRYFAMFLSPVGYLLQTLALLGIVVNGLRFPTWVLLLVGPIPGLVGDVSGLYVLMGSYISDITSEETRTLRITLLEASGMAAALSATISSGFIIEAYGYVGIFVASTVLLVLALMYLAFCVKPVNRMGEKSPRLIKNEDPDVNSSSDKEDIKASLIAKNEDKNPENDVKEELKADAIGENGGEVRGLPLCDEGRSTIARGDVNENDVKESEVSQKTGTGNISERCDSDLVRNAVHGNKIYSSEEDVVDTEADMKGNMGGGGVEVRNERSGDEVNENKGETTGHGCLQMEAIGSKTLPSLSTLSRREDDLSHECTAGDNQPLPVSDGGISEICDGRRTDNEKCSRDFENEQLGLEVKVMSEAGCEKKSFRSMLHDILKDSNPIQNLKRVHRILKAEGQIVNGLILFLLIFLSAVSYSGEMSIFALFLKNRPFFLTPRELGLYLAFECAAIAILGMVILNYLFTRVIKMDDNYLLAVSFCFGAVYYILLAFTQSLLMLYLVQLVHSVGSLNTCVIRSVLTKIAPASAVGLLFGALLMFETAGVLFGGMVCPIVYSRVAATQPGAVFFFNFSLALTGIVVTLALIIVCRNKGQNNVRNELTDLVDDDSNL